MDKSQRSSLKWVGDASSINLSTAPILRVFIDLASTTCRYFLLYLPSLVNLSLLIVTFSVLS